MGQLSERKFLEMNLSTYLTPQSQRGGTGPLETEIFLVPF